MTNSKEERTFERYKTNTKIEVQLGDVVYNQTEYLKDISYGGLSFKSTKELQIGTKIKIKIPLTNPEFQVEGSIVRCVKENDYYLVGVKYLGLKEPIESDLLQLVCDIEEYKKVVKEHDGKDITSEDAAIEWIKKYI